MDLSNKDIWREIPGFNGKYFINTNGEVYSKYKNILLKPYLDQNGYFGYHLSLNGKGIPKRAHRLVGLLFIPNPDGKPQINHIDGNKLNNKLENLEWCTNEENRKHALENNLISDIFRPKNKICVTHIETNQSKIFDSMYDVVRYIFPEVKSTKVHTFRNDIKRILKENSKNKMRRGYTFRYVD